MPSGSWWRGFDDEGRPFFLDPSASVGRVALLPMPTPIPPDESVEVRAMVADAVGHPVVGVSVTLVVTGVAHTVSSPADTDSDGYAVFTVTPLETGDMVLVAEAGPVSSTAATVTVALPLVYSTHSGRRKRAASSPVSYHDIGAPAPPPAAPQLAAAAAVQQSQQAASPRLVQALDAIVADQQCKLAAEAASMQQRMSS